MEIFYSNTIDGNIVTLDEEESGHCIRVLRHRRGDEISVIDGLGTMMRCRIIDDTPKSAKAQIVEVTPDWGGHPYRLDMAVCPTKNMDRYEWFAEKACEIGVDTIIPVIGDRSERRVIKTDRLRKILLSAAKQSLKARIPEILPPKSVKDFIIHSDAETKMIAYCFEDEKVPRISIKDALANCRRNNDTNEKGIDNEGIKLSDRHIQILIGPEGDFSPEEARLAVDHGFIPVHLGPSRLRTETAAVLAASAVYFHFM